MKKSKPTKKNQSAKKEVLLHLPTTPLQAARLKRAAFMTGETIEEYIFAAIGSFLQMSEELMTFDSEGNVSGFYQHGGSQSPILLKSKYPSISTL